MTVFKRGASPSVLLPSPELKAMNAQFWTDSVTEAVPAILARVGLTLEEQRIFISYRRLESQALAEQLFDALTHEGFDVFVDRFSIAPGVNFQQRLAQELADKSMVLLLESKWAHTSEWTNHEIQFAKRYKLGLLALQMPDRRVPLGSIDPDWRMMLDWRAFEKRPRRVENPAYKSEGKRPRKYLSWGTLNGSVLRDVIAKAKSIHDQAVFRRRVHIRQNVTATLQKAGLTPGPVGADGLMRVRGAADYALWLTTRPPELADFRTTHAGCGGPARIQRRDRRTDSGARTGPEGQAGLVVGAMRVHLHR